MRVAVLAKFLQNQDAQDDLLSTGDEELVEHTTNDKYWADGGNGSGKNMLGKILVEVRAVIKNMKDGNGSSVGDYVRVHGLDWELE